MWHDGFILLEALTPLVRAEYITAQRRRDAARRLYRHAGTQRTAHIPSEDVTIGARTIGKGEIMMPFIGFADRDPAQFPDPHRLDIARTDAHHMAFGDTARPDGPPRGLLRA